VTAPLLLLAGAFAAGVALGLGVPPPGWLAPAGLGLAALVARAAWTGRLVAASAGAVLLVALAGWARTALPDPWPALAGLPPGVRRLEGLVAGEVARDGPRTEVPLLVDAVVTGTGPARARGRLRALLYGPPLEAQPGDRVRLTVELRLARPFRNPGAASSWVRRERPALVAIGRTESVERRPPGATPWWLAVRLGVHRLLASELPPVSGALLEGLLIGERRQLPPTLLADFRAAGVFHVLAISGFNVALVAGSVVLALRLLRVPPRAAAALATLVLLLFAAVVGPEPSVLRATCMGVLAWSADLLGRESRAWNGLGAALLLLLAAEPASLADPGLQLSFAATAGILHLAAPAGRRLAPRLGRPAALAIGASLGAQLAVTPLMAVHFGQLSLVAPAANLLVVPLAAAATALGFLALVAAPVAGTVAHLLLQLLWALLVALRLAVRACAALPGALVAVPPPPWWAVAALALALAAAPRAAARRGGRAAVAGLLALAIGGTAARALPDGRLRIVMLDVGQGEAVLVRGPDGAALLVDAGGGGPGRANRGERVVLPALRHLGVTRLRALALTHRDPDHAGGLLAVLAGLPVDEVWLPAGGAAAGWEAALDGVGARWRALARGDRLAVGPLDVAVLHPPRPAAGGPGGAEAGPGALDANNGSLVLRVEWGLAAVLLMGDAEAPVERALLAAGLPLASPVLKVGHHGSRHATGAPFLAAVGPRLALVSAGAGNPFGHPTRDALGRLGRAGAEPARTDQDGAVEVWSDGTELAWRRWAAPGRVERYPLRGAP
jgi:competence protein ComEC